MFVGCKSPRKCSLDLVCFHVGAFDSYLYVMSDLRIASVFPAFAVWAIQALLTAYYYSLFKALIGQQMRTLIVVAIAIPINECFYHDYVRLK